jgi:hypothetical protein
VAWTVAGVVIAFGSWLGLAPLLFGGEPEDRKTLIVVTFGLGAIVFAVVVVERLRVQADARRMSSQFLPDWIGPSYEPPRRRVRLGWGPEGGPRGFDLLEVDLHEASLSGIDLDGAEMAGASLRNADLAAASLEKAHLADADLRGADLRGADLKGSNLAGASLEGARLEGADLSAANLWGADLRDASLAGAIHNRETLWPAGFFPETSRTGRHDPEAR